MLTPHFCFCIVCGQAQCLLRHLEQYLRRLNHFPLFNRLFPSMPLIIGKILSPGERKGLSVLVFCAFLSTVLAFSLFLYILRHVLRMRRRPVREEISPITLFYLSLLFFDSVQGIAWIIAIRWIVLGHVVMGNACVTQAILKQFDATGTSLSILAMSWCIFHDYVINSDHALKPRFGYIGLGCILIFQGGVIIIPNILVGGAYNYYGIATPGLWCWISDARFALKFITQYVWYWLAVVFPFFTGVTYFISSKCGMRLPAGFLWIGFPMEGNKLLRLGLFSIDSSDHGHRPKWSLSLDIKTSRRIISLMLPVPVQYFEEYEMETMPGVGAHTDSNGVTPIATAFDDTLADNTKLSPTTMTYTSNGPTPHQTDVDNATPGRSAHRPTNWKAIRLLLFPLSYLMLVLPFSIVRFIDFSHVPEGFPVIKSGTTIAVSSWFALIGTVDVVLFIGAGVAFGIDFSK